MDVLQWARHHRCFPGQGQFDLERFFVQVLRSGYAGPLSLEIFNDVFRETPNRRTAVDAMRSLLLPREPGARATRARCASTAATPRRESRPHATRPVRCAGGAEPGRLRLPRIRRRRRGGRRRLARCSWGWASPASAGHRSQGGQLYRQGSDPASSSTPKPGSSARAPLRRPRAVRSAPSALRRAEPGRRPTVRSPCCRRGSRARAGRTSCQLPAIISPGGNLVHFVPSARRRGARRGRLRRRGGKPAAARRRRCVAIDHIALGLATGPVRHLGPVQPGRARPRARRKPRARRPVRPDPQRRRRQRRAERARRSQRLAAASARAPRAR